MCEKVKRFIEEAKLEMKDEKVRLKGLLRSILSLISKLQINMDYAMELMDVTKEDQIKMMEMM